MDKQFLIDETYRLLLAQEGPSAHLYGSFARCQYRGPKGRKCAAGHWIPDGKYTPGIEGNSVLCTYVLETLPEALRSGELNRTLRALQRAHDDAAQVALIYGKSWPEALSAQFKARGLNVTES